MYGACISGYAHSLPPGDSARIRAQQAERGAEQTSDRIDQVPQVMRTCLLSCVPTY
jgi:hypothetical protein